MEQNVSKNTKECNTVYMTLSKYVICENRKKDSRLKMVQVQAKAFLAAYVQTASYQNRLTCYSTVSVTVR